LKVILVFCPKALCIREGPEYRPFHDPNLCLKPREHVKKQGRTCTQVLFPPKAELGFFHFLEIVTGWLVPSVGQKLPVPPGWYLPLRKIPLAENRFLHADKEADNTKEKSSGALRSVMHLLKLLFP
jgi:hypothetical protein